MSTRDKCSASLSRTEFNKFNNTKAQMLDSIYHMTITLGGSVHRILLQNEPILTKFQEIHTTKVSKSGISPI